MQGPETRESLLARLNSPQSDEGWREFAAIYRPLVCRVAKAKGLQHADAEDLTQEVLSVIERSLDQFDPKMGGFRSWLYQITRNLVVNHLTRRRGPIGSGDSDVRRMLSQQAVVDDQTATLFRLEYRRACFQHATSIVKAEFSDTIWSAFWLTAVELQSIASVAVQLGKSEGAIRVARCRVLDRLRVFVSENSGGFEPPE